MELPYPVKVAILFMGIRRRLNGSVISSQTIDKRSGFARQLHIHFCGGAFISAAEHVNKSPVILEDKISRIALSRDSCPCMDHNLVIFACVIGDRAIVTAEKRTHILNRIGRACVCAQHSDCPPFCGTSFWMILAASGNTSTLLLLVMKSNIPQVFASANAVVVITIQAIAITTANRKLTFFTGFLSSLFWSAARVRYTLVLKPSSASPNAFFKLFISRTAL